MPPRGKGEARELGICEVQLPISAGNALDSGNLESSAREFPKIIPLPVPDTKKAGLWGLGMGKPLRVDLEGKCGTLASSPSPPSLKHPDLGLCWWEWMQSMEWLPKGF